MNSQSFLEFLNRHLDNLNTKRAPMQDLPGWNPDCRPLSFLSIFSFNLFSVKLAGGLLAINSRVSPCQFEHSAKFPFFGILTISPISQSSGTFSFFYTTLHTFLDSFTMTSSSAFFSIPACIPSSPSIHMILCLYNVYIACDDLACLDKNVGWERFLKQKRQPVARKSCFNTILACKIEGSSAKTV